MSRRCASLAMVLAGLLVGVAPASAQVVQSVQVGAGWFFPRGFDSRTNGDALVGDLTDANPLAFKISDFRSGHLFGEWDVAFNDHVEVGAGVGFYSKSVPSVYRDLVNVDGSEIEQSLKLRVVPVTGLVRFLPFGRAGDVQPYVGAGISVLSFRYSESGEFVDPSDFSIFSDRFTSTGHPVGGLVLYGVRFPIRGDIYGLGLEGRYQFGTGNTGGNTNGFLGDKIDLSGNQFNVTFLIRF